MSDLFEQKENQDTKETVAAYYDKALKHVLEQNRKLSRLATDVNVAGGYVETYYARGIFRKDFLTPLAQAITAEEMANDGYFHLMLSAFTSLCSEIKTELSYKSKELLNETLHKKIFDFVNMQLDTVGGYETIFERVVKPSLRWGTGIGLPVMRNVIWQGKKYAGLTDIKTVNLQNVIQFFFEEENPSRISEIRYLTYPKTVTTELSSSVDPEKISGTETTEVNIKTINCRYNATAVTAHNSVDGNPLGLPYLYFLYPIWKTYKAMLEGTYNSMISFGQYPFGVKRTSKESGADPVAWENRVKAELEEIIALGGAPFVDGEGEMYTLEPPDTQKLFDAQKSIFDIASRSSGLGQITMGIDGGGSKNLTESVDMLTDKHVKATVKSALIDISETFIKNLVKINFASEYNRGKIIEFPALRIKETDENDIMTSGIKENSSADMRKERKEREKTTQSKNTPLIEIKNLKNVNVKNVKETSGETVFKVLQKEPNEIEKQIIVDAKAFDDFLSGKTEDLAAKLGIFLKPKLKEAVEKIIRNPGKNMNVWGLFEKRKFENEMREAVKRIAQDSAAEEAMFTAKSFNLGNTTFEEQMKTDVYTYANKISQKYLKTTAYKDIVNAAVIEAENFIRSYAAKQNAGFVLENKNDINKIIFDLQNQVDDLKGKDFTELAKNTALKTFINVSDFENKETLAKTKNYALFRSGMLEKPCPRCESRIGKIYCSDNEGNLTADDGEILVLPDPLCKGRLGGHVCRCMTVPIPAGTLFAIGTEKRFIG